MQEMYAYLLLKAEAHLNSVRIFTPSEHTHPSLPSDAPPLLFKHVPTLLSPCKPPKSGLPWRQPTHQTQNVWLEGTTANFYGWWTPVFINPILYIPLSFHFYPKLPFASCLLHVCLWLLINRHSQELLNTIKALFYF